MTSPSSNGLKREESESEAAGQSLPAELWDFRLYIAGQTPKSLTASVNLEKLCEAYLAGHYHIQIIDLLLQPHLAREDQILAIPTLVRRLPEPTRKIIGDLSNTARVLLGLEIGLGE